MIWLRSHRTFAVDAGRFQPKHMVDILRQIWWKNMAVFSGGDSLLAWHWGVWHWGVAYLGVHEDEGQLGGQLAGQRAQVQLHLHAVRHHDAEGVALVRVQQPADTATVLQRVNSSTVNDIDLEIYFPLKCILFYLVYFLQRYIYNVNFRLKDKYDRLLGYRLRYTLSYSWPRGTRGGFSFSQSRSSKDERRSA